VKDNLIYTQRKRIAVLKIEPINFSIKPTGEQEAIALAFQKLLNSLDFPIQLLMTTETLNLEEYLENLKANIGTEKNSLKIFEEYQNHIKNIVKENSVMNRNFYLVIPESSSIDIQLKICEDRLNNLNLKASRLTDKELKAIFNKICNSEAENFFPEKIKNDIDCIKVITKLETDENYKKRLKEHKKELEELKKNKKKNDKKEKFEKDKLDLEYTFQKIIYASGYPRIVEAGFLDRIVSCSGNFDLSMHIEPYSLENTMVNLNKELQKQRADLYAAKLKSQLNPSLEIKYADTQKILENLQKGKEKLFNISLYINCKARTKEELDLLTKKIESELNSLLIMPKQAPFRVVQGFKSCLPIAENTLGEKRNITTAALSAFFPFTSSFFKFDKTGIWFGLNKNNIPLIKDIFKLSNANGVCLATSGSGKSYMAKLFISRYLLNGTKVIVIDPQGEYVNLVKRFKGQRIDLSRTSETIINPLDLMGHDYPEKRLALMDLMPVMLGELTEPQKSWIDKALTKAYESKGITMDDESSWNNTPPVLKDVLIALMQMEKRAITLEKSTIRSLINRLDIYVNGVFSFLNKQTKINFDNKFVCFDIGNMPKQVKPVVMFLVLDYVYMKMKSDLERKLLVIDEAWALLGRTEDASYIFEIVKTCRKFNLGLFLINQEVEGMLASEAGRSVLANTSYTLLLRQKPAVIEDIQKIFHLSNTERIALLTAGVGEGLLLMDDDHSEIKIVASEIEHRQITTNADEILANKEKQDEHKQEQNITKKNVAVEALAKQRSVNISVDENKGFYRHRDLKLDDLKYLTHRGYKQYSFQGILSSKKELYILKPRFNETAQHFFLTYDIANYLKTLTEKVWLFETKKPDIVFEINNQKYAIEIETGILYKDKKAISEKVEALNKEYGKNWFFVVTNRNFYPKYAQLGETYTKLSVVKKILQIVRSVNKLTPEKTELKESVSLNIDDKILSEVPVNTSHIGSSQARRLISRIAKGKKFAPKTKKLQYISERRCKFSKWKSKKTNQKKAKKSVNASHSKR
jgi:type IV secretory pathway VirB4 component